MQAGETMEDEMKLINENVCKDIRVKSNKRTTNAKLKYSVTILLAVISCTAAIALGHIIFDSSKSSFDITGKWNGFTYEEISDYEIQYLLHRFDVYNFYDYSYDGAKRAYNYTAEDYKKLYGVTEANIRGFYLIATEDSVDEFCRAFGYNNLDDYLIKKGFVTNGKPDLDKWHEADLNYFSSFMKIDEETKKR